MVDFLIEEAEGSKVKADPADENLLNEQPGSEKNETPDEVETLASELGWRPDGELDAKEYILKSRDIQDTMRTHIKDQKKQLSDFSVSVAELKTHNEKVYKAEVARLKTELSELKEEKKTAIEDGDVGKVDALDEQIDGVKEAIAAPKDTAPDSNPELDAWMEKNPWYKSDPEMAKYADEIADDNLAAPYGRMLSFVATKVKQMFPDKFKADPANPANPANPAPGASPVEPGRRSVTPAKFTKADLTPSQTNIMTQFVRQGIMTEKQYIADIAKTQGV